MTTSTDIKKSYPLPVYNYKVEIGEKAVAFSEVSGLSISFETTTYKESPTGKQVGPKVFLMPGQRNSVNITLRKGVVRVESIKELYSWISATQINQIEKKDIFIRLMDEEGNAVISWIVHGAFPTKLDAPSFDAKSSDAAIESMELMADRVTIEEASA